MTRLKNILTIDELSNYLKISINSLYKLAQQRRIPGKKVGKHWRFDTATINSWIVKGEQKNGR